MVLLHQENAIAHLIDAFPAGDWLLFNNQPVMITHFPHDIQL